MQEAYDEILPDYVEKFMGSFAEIRQIADGMRYTFKVKRGRQRANSSLQE